MGGSGAEESADGGAEGGLHGFDGGGGVGGEGGGDAFAAEEFFGGLRYGGAVCFFDAVAEKYNSVAALELDLVNVKSSLFEHSDGEAVGFEDGDFGAQALAGFYKKRSRVAGIGVA